MKRSTPLLWILPVILFAGCGKPPKAKPKAVDVFVAEVQEKYITPTAQIIGQVKADKSVNLVARVKGFLMKQNFTEGQMVKKGRLLFLIEQTQYQAQVKASEAEVLKAQAKLKNAMIEYNRQKTLLYKNATSERKFDDATSNKMQSEAMLMNAQANLAEAKLNLSYTSVMAPFDGRVGLVNYDVGNVVGPESGTLANVVRMDLVRVMFNISEVDMLKVMERNKGLDAASDNIAVKLRFQDGQNYGVIGKISYWSNQINISTGTLKMEATFENPKHLLIPGMYVHVIFEGKKKKQALLCPREAILENQTGKYVLLVDKKNIVDERQVEVGTISGTYQQITSGLQNGDRVIISGIQKVRKGVLVKPLLDKDRDLVPIDKEQTTPVKNKKAAPTTPKAGSK